jgi:Glycosyl transferase family 2
MQWESLAVCMIVRDAAGDLERCLASLSGVPCALHVTDTGSIDGTVEVARRFGAELRHFPWVNDFAAARNASIAGVTARWIVVLDADDAFETGGFAALAEACAGFAPDVMAATLEYEVRADHTPERALRVFRNTAHLAFEGCIHESTLTWLEARHREGGRIVSTDIRLIHYGYTPDAMPGKVARNLPLLRAEWESDFTRRHPARRLQIAGELGMTLSQAGEWSAADAFLTDVLGGLRAAEIPPGLRPAWLRLWVFRLWIVRQSHGAEAAWHEARAMENVFAGLSAYALHRGLAAAAAARWADARHWLAVFAARSSPPEIPVESDYLGHKLHTLRGACAFSDGDPVEACQLYEQAAVMSPADPEIPLRLRLARLACNAR